MKIKKVFEDDNLIIFNKPTGWIVNIANTAKNQPNLQRYIEENYKFEIARDRKFRSGIVHRLDKETSGLIIVAKDKISFKFIQNLFKERKVNKTYRALVHGKVELEEGRVMAPVGRLPWNRERFGVVPGGRKAHTEYKVINSYQKGEEIYSLLELYPKTGRTHQIRIHMKYLGYPLVSDNFYAGRKTSRKDRTWCKRLFLHASQLTFRHPVSKKDLNVDSDVPKDLKDALNKLNKLNEVS